jgi:hypothetical protein
MDFVVAGAAVHNSAASVFFAATTFTYFFGRLTRNSGDRGLPQPLLIIDGPNGNFFVPSQAARVRVMPIS